LPQQGEERIMTTAVKDGPITAGRVTPVADSPRRFQRLRRDRLLVALGLRGATALILFQTFRCSAMSSPSRATSRIWVSMMRRSSVCRTSGSCGDGNPSFRNALVNTLILTVVQAVFVFPIPLGIALLLNSLAG
jgi:putative aldouronate transport system permease protein